MRISDWSSDVCSSDLFVVEPMAKQPVAAAPDILDAVIVARQPLVVAAAPPFGGDAPGPFVAAHRMKRPAPAEALRRAVGDLGDHLARPRRIEVPEGTRRRLAGRSEERQVGQECVSTGCTRGAPDY